MKIGFAIHDLCLAWTFAFTKSIPLVLILARIPPELMPLIKLVQDLEDALRVIFETPTSSS